MNAAPGETLGWPRKRWWAGITLALVLQVVLIYWFGERGGVRHRTAELGPAMRVIDSGPSDLLALKDPTLFALPHGVSFSGRAWLKSEPQAYTPFAWSEPPQWLALPAEQLGAAFHGLLRTNLLEVPPLSTMPNPEPMSPRTGGPELLPTISTLRLTVELAERRLLTQPERA
jgi:hypothetical protein